MSSRDPSTDVVFPMLHVDTGEARACQFSATEGADGPVIVDETALVFPISAARMMPE